MSDLPPKELTWEGAVDQIDKAVIGKVWQENLQTTKRTLSIVCYGRAGFQGELVIISLFFTPSITFTG